MFPLETEKAPAKQATSDKELEKLVYILLHELKSRVDRGDESAIDTMQTVFQRMEVQESK